MAHLAVDSRGWTKRGEGEASRARERGELNGRSGAAGPWDGDKCPSQRGRIGCDSRERTAESEPSREASSSLRRGLARPGRRARKRNAHRTVSSWLARSAGGRAGATATHLSRRLTAAAGSRTPCPCRHGCTRVWPNLPWRPTSTFCGKRRGWGHRAHLRSVAANWSFSDFYHRGYCLTTSTQKLRRVNYVLVQIKPKPSNTV
jgi:hypothetical protein